MEVKDNGIHIFILPAKEEEICNFLVFSRFLSECEMDLAFSGLKWPIFLVWQLELLAYHTHIHSLTYASSANEYFCGTYAI